MKQFILFLFALISFSSHGYEITDDRGQKIVFSSPPKRVVSLLPSLSESVCALNLCSTLVGVDRFSNYPVSLQRLPILGGGLDPSIERIVALKPDLVLMSPSTKAATKLESLGLKVVTFESNNYEDVRRVLGRLAEIYQVSGSDAIWQSAQAQIQSLRGSLPILPRPVKVYFEVSTGPYAASESSFIGETLSKLGLQNVVPKNLGPFPKLNPEFVIQSAPDVIIISETDYPDLKKRPGWSQMNALRLNRVCLLDKDQTDILVRPGPRMGESARIITNCLLRFTASEHLDSDLKPKSSF